MRHNIRRRVLAGLSLLPLSAALPRAFAQDKYPSKPIKLLVGFPPGGGADAIGRLMGGKLA